MRLEQSSKGTEPSGMVAETPKVHSRVEILGIWDNGTW